MEAVKFFSFSSDNIKLLESSHDDLFFAFNNVILGQQGLLWYKQPDPHTNFTVMMLKRKIIYKHV